jgi:hypothetical protein
MVTRKKSKPETQKAPKKARAAKAPATKPEQAPISNADTRCVSSCPQDAKQFFSKLLAIYGNKYYILLAGASVGFMIGVVVDHLLIKG